MENWAKYASVASLSVDRYALSLYVCGNASQHLASFPGAEEEEEERAPGTYCLRMRVIIAKAACTTRGVY